MSASIPGAPEDAARPATPDVVAQLVDNHREFLRFLERRVGSRAVAEDILQDAFVRGLDRLETLRDDESVVAWFYRALRNAVVDAVRRADARRRAHEAAASERDTVVPAIEARRSVCRCVTSLASELKPDLATAIRRVDVEGATVAELAAEAGITPNNARVRLFRARTALRDRVRASCGHCAEGGCRDCSCAPHAHDDHV